MEVLEKNLNLLQEMIEPEYDWEESESGIEEVFSECFIWHDYEKKGDRPIGTKSCGSYGFEDTPKSFYRLLYLVHPIVDFSDMYKPGTLIEICSPDYNFRAGMEFHKYELAARFGCAKEYAIGREHMVQCGVPGSDNGIHCSSDIGKLWFETLIKCLNFELSVYPGNDFCV